MRQATTTEWKLPYSLLIVCDSLYCREFYLCYLSFCLRFNSSSRCWINIILCVTFYSADCCSITICMKSTCKHVCDCIRDLNKTRAPGKTRSKLYLSRPWRKHQNIIIQSFILGELFLLPLTLLFVLLMITFDGH